MAMELINKSYYLFKPYLINVDDLNPGIIIIVVFKKFLILQNFM